MHVRTKRKPNKKNISKLIFSIVLTFIMIAAIFSLGNIKKGNFNFSKKADDASTTSAGSVTSSATNEFWILNVQNVLSTAWGDKIFVQIASTSAEQEQGLSGKNKLTELDKDGKIETEGMLFSFYKPQIENFWMKDMNFDLDMVWLDENFKIVHIEKNTLASSYNKQNPANSTIFTNGNNLAKYVLEINSGMTDKLNLKVGDSLKINP
jgi:hypothetical protein